VKYISENNIGKYEIELSTRIMGTAKVKMTPWLVKKKKTKKKI
jgi:hypothetical protein